MPSGGNVGGGRGHYNSLQGAPEILHLQGTPSAVSQSDWLSTGERPPITALNTAQMHIHVGSGLELAEGSES